MKPLTRYSIYRYEQMSIHRVDLFFALTQWVRYNSLGFICVITLYIQLFNIIDEPRNPQCSKDFEAFRNVANCGEFFICVNRLPVKFVCPADLYFNEVITNEVDF